MLIIETEEGRLARMINTVGDSVATRIEFPLINAFIQIYRVGDIIRVDIKPNEPGCHD